MPPAIAAIQVDTDSFFVIVVVAAIAAITVAVVPEALRAAGRRARAAAGDPDRPAGPRPRPHRRLHRILLQPRPRDALLLRRLRDRLPADQGQAAGARRLGLAALGRRSPTGSAASSPAAGVVVSFLYTGSAMATTAIGTLIPILRDNGELKTRFGTYLLAAGGAGEFGPILLVTLVLSTDQPPARGGDPDRLRRPRARRRAGLGAARLARLAGARAHLRGEQPARGAGHRRPRLRPRRCSPASSASTSCSAASSPG